MRKSIALALAGGAGVVLCSASVQGAIWNLPAAGSWNVNGNWTPNTAFPNAVGASATFNSAASGSNPAQTGDFTVAVGTTITVGSITFNHDAANAFNTSLQSSGSFTFDEVGAGPATITCTSVTGATGNDTITRAMTLNDNLVLNINNTTATNVQGALNLTGAMSGNGGITKNGDGGITTGTGAKTYTGATIVNGGRWRSSSSGAPTATSSFTINSGGMLDLTVAASYTLGTGPLNLNGAGPTSGPFAAFPGAIRNDTGLVVTITNAVNLQSDTVLHVQAAGGTGSSATPTGSLTFSGAVTGVGKLTFTGANSNIDQGTLILSNALNAYTGGTLVSGGIVSVTGSGTLGTADVEVNDSLSPSSIARLSLATSTAINDGASLKLQGGGASGVADENFAILATGVNETVNSLYLNGVLMPAGVYGSSTSPAPASNQLNEYFSGDGVVTVLVPEPASLSLLTLAGVALLGRRRRA
jgi:autotransporter-associated beta strand protein